MSRFIDANVIVNGFANNKDKIRCRKILDEGFITDMVCVAEAQDALTTILKDKEKAINCVRSLFKGDNIILPVDKNIFFEALKKANISNLFIMDAIHYAAALLNNCSEIISYDKDFDGLEIKRAEP